MGKPVIIKKPVFSGTTRFLDLFFFNQETGQGFKPDTVTLSIYDVTWPGTQSPRCAGQCIVYPAAATQSIVNDRNDVDVTDQVNADGSAPIELTPEDTEVVVPSGPIPSSIWRRLLFTAYWDGSPAKIEKQEVTFPITPDRETVVT